MGLITFADRFLRLIMPLIVAFALGWFMRGDMIFGKMYNNDVNNIGSMLPVKGLR